MDKKGLERLYLAKGDTENCSIYVDTVPLPPHQYDGVRFLYKQFKKDKAGVVLNDPSGYGKRVQAVLFLNAVSPILTLPTLILCPEGREDMWMHLFRQWTNIGSDISVQHGHEYTKSMCLVGNFTQINVLSRREWGILVVDDNHVSRDVLRSGLSASYRIWLTTIDMKKNLQTFSLIYKWLYPRERFTVEEFLSTKKKPSVVLTKSTRLDAFMEDIVIRRRGVTVPLGNSHHMPDPPRVSRKNKDATGKKIKRSKPLPVSDHDTSGESEDIRSKDRQNGEASKNNESVEDFEVNIENNLDNGNQDLTQSDIKSECDDKEQKLKEELKNYDDIKEQSNMDVNLNETVDNKNPENDVVNQPSSQNDSLNILNNCCIDSQSIIIKYDSDTPDLDEAIHDDEIPTKRLKLGNEINFTTNKINDVSASVDLFPMDTEPNDITSEDITNDHDIKSDDLDTKSSTYVTSNEDIHKETADELNNEIEIGDLNCKKDELDESNVSKEKTEPKLDGIELKMKQMEELVKKKFNGTFLDSIF